MKGKRIRRDGRFSEVFAPILPRFAELFWLLDCQAGPFSYTELPDHDSIGAELDRHLVDVPRFANTSSSLWKPGVLPRFAPLLWENEGSYLVALPGPERSAVVAAIELLNAEWLTPSFFADLANRCECFIMMVAHGWWEAYSPRPELLQDLNGEPGVSEVDSSVWSGAP